MENPTKMDENWGYPYFRKPSNLYVFLFPLTFEIYRASIPWLPHILGYLSGDFGRLAKKCRWVTISGQKMGWVSGVELPRKFGVQKSGSHGITSTYLKIAICMWNMMLNHAILGCIIFRRAAWLNIFAFPQAISGTHELVQNMEDISNRQSWWRSDFIKFPRVSQIIVYKLR